MWEGCPTKFLRRPMRKFRGNFGLFPRGIPNRLPEYQGSGFKQNPHRRKRRSRAARRGSFLTSHSHTTSARQPCFLIAASSSESLDALRASLARQKARLDFGILALRHLVPVPEAAVNENRLSPTRESEVGFTGQLSEMKPKAVTQGVCDLTHAHLRLCVPAADSAHVRASLFLRHLVGHSPNFLRSQPNTARCSSCPARRT